MSPEPSTRKRILIIEDEADFSTLLDFHLTRKNYETTKAFDGLAGVHEALRNPPDLVILDVLLPKLNGFDVCYLLRSTSATKHLPILIVTSLDDSTGHKIRAYGSGADGYFAKKDQVQKLLTLIDSILSAR